MGHDSKYGSSYVYLSTVEADGTFGFGVDNKGKRKYGGNASAEYSAVDIELKSNDWDITDDIKVNFLGEGEILNAGAELGAGYSSSKGVHVSGGAMASGASGKLEGSTTIFGVEFAGSIKGRAGAIGVEGALSAAGNEQLFYSKLGLAALFGVTLEFSVGLE